MSSKTALCAWKGAYQTDLVIEGERIVSLGKTTYSGSEEVIDADGMYVVPGGIDAHTHMDATISAVSGVR